MTARRILVEVLPAIVVSIEVERTEAERMKVVRDETGKLRAFRDWLYAEEIYPVRGTGGGSPGSFFGVFEAEHGPAIQAWLRDHDLEAE